MKDTKRKMLAVRILSALVLGATVCFIFAQSAQSGVSSSKKSAPLTEALNHIFAQLGGFIQLSEHLVRKAAHFIEYAVLGFVLWCTRRIHSQKVSRILLGLFLVPVLDESLQYFVPGRSAQVKDVLLDYSGMLAGTLGAWVLGKILVKNKQ